ncbi:hypothetical protein OsccyDRAFT_3671 [Leptolyngbyaceae cyanobacterium JSC-12]|nr:hypothetical protein OsccyDRAFT_3671 [Leptolyngbyaceae cyanobacterium JSC-12]
MRRGNLLTALSLAITLMFLGKSAHALPGQTADEAASWIQANPTLRPASGERLLVRKSDSPAQRFTFQALPIQVGRAATGFGGSVIRTEELALFDMIKGITFFRLEEALRAIYGPAIYQDYAQATKVYNYPTQGVIGQAINRNTPLLAATQGEVRAGDRYAYWLEITRRPDGFAYAGRLTVFLREDLPKLEAELKRR